MARLQRKPRQRPRRQTSRLQKPKPVNLVALPRLVVAEVVAFNFARLPCRCLRRRLRLLEHVYHNMSKQTKKRRMRVFVTPWVVKSVEKTPRKRLHQMPVLAMRSFVVLMIVHRHLRLHPVPEEAMIPLPGQLHHR